MNANTEKIYMGSDPLNVLPDEVKPLPDHVLRNVILGRDKKTVVLDGSKLEQHHNLIPYAHTHVEMKFDNEDDLIKCVRLLQWSDERMRSRKDPNILWEWTRGYRFDMSIYFTVSWYSKDFFEDNKDAFKNKEHANYYSKFGMHPSDIRVEHEILTQS
jgi:hypothetical protein